jgi:carbonic anhydrase
MENLNNLFANNRQWAKNILTTDSQFFQKLTKQQSPKYLWIGCSDSRVPANEIVGLLPGELFVHRNVANLVVHTDMNCLSVMQYAIDVLQIKHIIVCGHYGCGGVAASIEERPHGLIDNWLRNVREIYFQYEKEINAIKDPVERVNRLCEMNVASQVYNVCNTTIVQDAWSQGQEITVHGWIYGIHDGLLRDLNVSVSSVVEMRQLGVR